jgi:hypothetical protein
MASRSGFLPDDRRQWLLAIGQRLRAEYSALRDPIPERLGALLAQLEAAQETAPAQERYGSAATPTAERGPPVERGAASRRGYPCTPLDRDETASAGLDLR